MKRKILILLVVLFFGLGLTFSSQAGVSTTQGTLVERLKESKLIEAGTHVGEKLNAEEADYYQMAVKPGQQIKIYGSAEAGKIGPASKIRFTLYNEEGKILSKNEVSPYQDPAKAESANVFYLPGTTTKVTPQTKSNLAYFEVAFPETNRDYWIKVYSFAFLLDTDKTDLNLDTDSSDDFSKASEVKAGDYPKNFLAKSDCGSGKYCSTDYKDTYKITLKAKEKLTIKITPDKNLQPVLNFYNKDEKKQEGGKTAADKGMAVEAFYISPEDQTVYFAISDAAEGDYYGSYAMSVALAQATTEELIEVGLVEEEVSLEEVPEITPEEEKITEELPKEVTPPEIPTLAETFLSQIRQTLIWWIVGFVVFIALIVTVITLVKRARKPPKPPVPPAKETAMPPGVSKPEERPMARPGMILPPKELREK